MDNVKVFGEVTKYIAIRDVNKRTKLQDDFSINSTRIWAETGNEVRLIKAPYGDDSWGQVDMAEFAWIKLKCRYL